MTDRYYAATPVSGGIAALDGPEAHHLIHVMRASVGEEVVLFDGSGLEFSARVEKLGRSRVELAVLERRRVDRELAIEVTLGVALPKGDRARWLVEKVVELGGRRIVPLVTARSVAGPTEKTLTRLRRTVVEASKQCGRNRLLEIAEPVAWAGFLTEVGSEPCRLLAHPRGEPCAWPSLERALPQGIVAAVGPEGGFTPDEVELAKASGWRTVDLGRRILRVETAAAVILAWAGALTAS